MPLIDSIQRIINKILEEMAATGTSETALEVERRAIGAVTAGQGDPGQITPQWKFYMEFFSGDPINPDHLARLLPSDDTHGNADMQKERAYLVGNGVCGATTTDTTLDGGVTDHLGQTIS
jgi:hypothetical protein